MQDCGCCVAAVLDVWKMCSCYTWKYEKCVAVILHFGKVCSCQETQKLLTFVSGILMPCIIYCFGLALGSEAAYLGHVNKGASQQSSVLPVPCMM
jgi:hypothetical protein